MYLATRMGKRTELLYLQTLKNMRYLLALVICVFGFLGSHSQTYEVGGFLGGANYIGDVGKTNYINPKDIAFGGIFKWNRSPRHSFRASLIYAEISADDLDSSEERRQQRGYSFENNLLELSVGIEYTFWEFNLHTGLPQTAPYLYTGLTIFGYDSLFRRRTEIVSFDRQTGIAIPMVVGLKTTLGTRFVLAGEIGARYTFTDNLDGSNPTGTLENEPGLEFGNINSTDWYVFTGITLTVEFGRKPCYCNF